MEFGCDVLIATGEVLDRLLLAVLEDFEVVTGKVGQEIRLLVRDGDPEADDLGPQAERGLPALSERVARVQSEHNARVEGLAGGHRADAGNNSNSCEKSHTGPIINPPRPGGV